MAVKRSESLASPSLTSPATAERLKSDGPGRQLDEGVTTPIGIPQLAGKEPATIAVGVAADLLLRFGHDPTTAAREVQSRAHEGRPAQADT